MKVFFDTSAFIALFISQEETHTKLRTIYTAYRKQRASFYTSYYVLDELFTRLIYDFGKIETEKIIHLLMKSVERDEMRPLEVDQTIFNKSLTTLLKFSEHKISLTDASTYVLYKDFKLDEICTLDSNFKKIGACTSF